MPFVLSLCIVAPAAAESPPGFDDAARFAALEARPLQTFTNVELAEYLQLRTASLADVRHERTPAEEVGFFAARGLGTPYRLNSVRFDLGEADCVTFVERTLALALAEDWQSYYRLCERLRHKDGIVAYKNRNFHTLADWLPNNCWLLEDVTEGIGQESVALARPFTHVVRPKVFAEVPAAPGSKYTRIVFKGSDYRSGEKEIRSSLCIARNDIAAILPQLRAGDVVLVLRDSAGGHMACDHMGVICREAGDEPWMIHAAKPASARESLRAFMFRHAWVSAVKVLRIRPDALARVKLEVASVQGVVMGPEVADQKAAALRH